MHLPVSHLNGRRLSLIATFLIAVAWGCSGGNNLVTDGGDTGNNTGDARDTGGRDMGTVDGDMPDNVGTDVQNPDDRVVPPDVQGDTGGGDTGSCTPSPEVCNGRDDDCDGMTDEDLGTTTCGMGECRRTVPNCVGGMPRSCMAGTPGMETCDGLDNDCDGMVDDGLGMTTCGMGACQRTVNNCDMGAPAMCTPGRPGTETCNGMDDDCNGMVDDGLGSSTCGRGACQRTVMNCMGGMTQMCVPGAATAEVCDGVDNNCDGSVDEGFPMTTCGMGACQRTVSTCSGGMMMMCVPGMPVAETCNSVDDDCDGMVDDCPVGPGATGAVCGGTPLSCRVTGCTPGNYDVDGNSANGCECSDPATNTTCASATNLGALNLGGSVTSAVGRTPPAAGAGSDDWYIVTFNLNADFNAHGTGTPQIRFAAGSDPSYRFEVHGVCGSPVFGCGTGSTSATGLTTWSFNDTCVAGGTNCSTRTTSWPSTVTIRVFRTTAGTSCGTYQLIVSR